MLWWFLVTLGVIAVGVYLYLRSADRWPPEILEPYLPEFLLPTSDGAPRHAGPARRHPPSGTQPGAPETPAATAPPAAPAEPVPATAPSTPAAEAAPGAAPGAEPGAAPAAPAAEPPAPLAELVKVPGAVPLQVALLKETALPVFVGQSEAGSITVPAGASLQVVGVGDGTVEVMRGDARAKIPVASTDFEAQVRARHAALAAAAAAAAPAAPATTGTEAAPAATGTQAAPATTSRPVLERHVDIDVQGSHRDVEDGLRNQGRAQLIRVRVRLTNTSTLGPFDQIEGKVFVFGKHVNIPGMYQLVTSEDFTCKLGPRENYEYATREFTLRSHSGLVRAGFRYDGWLLLLKDKSGNATVVKASSPTYDRPDKVSDLTVGTVYDRNLEEAANQDF